MHIMILQATPEELPNASHNSTTRVYGLSTVKLILRARTGHGMLPIYEPERNNPDKEQYIKRVNWNFGMKQVAGWAHGVKLGAVAVEDHLTKPDSVKNQF